MKKLRSFTIIELVVTMIITAIVVSMAYYSWFLVSAQFNKYTHRSMEIENYYLLSHIWQKDFEKADAIWDSIDDKHIVFIHDDTCIRYSIGSNCIVREANAITDSFGIRVGHTDFVYVDDTIKLIKAITLSTIINGDSVLLSGNKLYSSKEIMSAQTITHE